MKNLIFVSAISSILGALIVGGIVYFVLNNSFSEKQTQLNNQISALQKQIEALEKQNEPSQKSPTPMKTQPSTSDNTIAWIEVEDKELGFSFSYPAKYGEFQLSFDSGETGKLYRGYFPDNKYFSIGGITADFTSGKGGLYHLNFVKYLYENGKYYGLSALNKKWLLTPFKIITVDGQKVLITRGDYEKEGRIYCNSRNPECGDYLIAFINLPGAGEFKGLVIWNYDKKVLPQSDFEEIIKTFKFVK